MKGSNSSTLLVLYHLCILTELTIFDLKDDIRSAAAHEQHDLAVLLHHGEITAYLDMLNRLMLPTSHEVLDLPEATNYVVDKIDKSYFVIAKVK